MGDGWPERSKTQKEQVQTHFKNTDQGPVHTTTFSGENGKLLLRFGSSFTQQWRFECLKTGSRVESFQNTPISVSVCTVIGEDRRHHVPLCACALHAPLF